MDSIGIPYDKNNDVHSREMQYLVPPTQPHHVVVSTAEQTSAPNGPVSGQIPRNLSTGTLQELQAHRQLSRIGSSVDLTVSRRPSAAVAAIQRPTGHRSILIEYVQHYQFVLLLLLIYIVCIASYLISIVLP